MDKSILSRFNPDGLELPVQYLANIGGKWEWTEDRAAAFVFDSHGEAQRAAHDHRYQDKAGDWHDPWALVRGNPVVNAEREKKQRQRIEQTEASVPRRDWLTKWEAANDQ